MKADPIDTPSVSQINAPPPGEVSAGRRWRTGTLVYTAGTLAALFFWLLWGDFTLRLKESSAGPTLQLLLKHFSASNTTIGVLFVSIPACVSTVLSPIIGYRSDRHRGRWGRRMPYLIVPTPIAVIALTGMAFSPVIGGWVYQLAPSLAPMRVDVICAIGIFWTLFEMCSTISGTGFSGLVNDVVPHELMGRFCALFRVVGLTAAMIFTYKLLGVAEEHYTAIFLSTGILFGISFALMCLMVREGEYPPPPPNAGGPWAGTKVYLRDSVSHSYYVWLYTGVALINMSFNCITAFTLFFAVSLHMGMQTYGEILTLQLFISLVQSLPIGWLCDTIHSMRVILIALILYTLATLLSFIFVRNAWGFGVALVAIGAAAGWWYSAFSPMCAALLPRDKFTQFASAMDIYSAVGKVIIGYTCGKFLDWMHSDYRYIYLWAFVLGAMSLVAIWIVYRKFLRYGGPWDYTAPAIRENTKINKS